LLLLLLLLFFFFFYPTKLNNVGVASSFHDFLLAGRLVPPEEWRRRETGLYIYR